jgi:hypothetical protein
MTTSAEDKERILNLEGRLNELYARAALAPTINASGNYWTMQNVTGIGTQTGTAAGAVAIASIVLIPQFTGLFRVDCHLDFSCNTTAIKPTVQLVSDTVAGATVLPVAGAGGATVATNGWGGSQFRPPGSLTVLANFGRILTSNAAGVAANGIIYNGAPFTTAPIIQKSSTQTSLTGLLTTNGSGNMHFSASGIMGNSIGAAAVTPFAINNGLQPAPYSTVAFAVTFADTTTGAEVWTFGDLNFTVQELMIA